MALDGTRRDAGSEQILQREFRMRGRVEQGDDRFGGHGWVSFVFGIASAGDDDVLRAQHRVLRVGSLRAHAPETDLLGQDETPLGDQDLVDHGNDDELALLPDRRHGLDERATLDTVDHDGVA